MDYCISGQRTYTKVQVPQFCPIPPWRKSLSGQHDVRFESKSGQFPNAIAFSALPQARAIRERGPEVR